jgi:hypothetical protein
VFSSPARSDMLLLEPFREAVKSLVQSWVQLEAFFQPKMARKLRQINESLMGAKLAALDGEL